MAHQAALHLYVPFPPCCGQCSPSTCQPHDHAWRNPSPVPFCNFLFCVCAAVASDPLTKVQQVCMFAWLLWFLADEHPGIASTFSSESLFRCSSKPPELHNVRSALCLAVCVPVLPDCQLMISRWQAWSAGNHLQSAELVCVPSARQDESSYPDPSLRLDVPACCGTASCSQPQLAPSWFHLE